MIWINSPGSPRRATRRWDGWLRPSTRPRHPLGRPQRRSPARIHGRCLARVRGAKNGGACGTAKFREETSKKADSATGGRIAAAHNLGGRSFVYKDISHRSIHEMLDNEGTPGSKRPLTETASLGSRNASAPRHQGGVLSFLPGHERQAVAPASVKSPFPYPMPRRRASERGTAGADGWRTIPSFSTSTRASG